MLRVKPKTACKKERKKRKKVLQYVLNTFLGENFKGSISERVTGTENFFETLVKAKDFLRKYANKSKVCAQRKNKLAGV